MKFIRIVSFVLATIALLSMLTGCDSEPFTYEFRQARSNVEKVEICSYDHKARTVEVLVQLEDADVDALLADIQALPCMKWFPLDTPMEYGDVVILITYFDGEVEMIGITNIGWRTADGTDYLSLMYFEIADICAVIAKYADPSVLAKVSGYF